MRPTTGDRSELQRPKENQREQDRIPMHWPAEWAEPSRLKLLEGTPINCLIGETPPPFPLGDDLEPTFPLWWKGLSRSTG